MRAKIAYGVHIHSNPNQFWWTINSIYNKQDVFSIHIDLKTPNSTYQAFKKIIGPPCENITFLPRMEVFWGGWTCAKVTIESIRHLLAFDRDWTHFINISGNCYPLHSRDHRIDYLLSKPNTNFVQLCEHVSSSPIFRDRIEWEWVWRERRESLLQLLHRTFLPLRQQRKLGEPVKTNTPKPPPSGFNIEFNGEAWHVLTRSFCEWIVTDGLANDIMNYFVDVAIPEESVMQALLLNSPFRATAGPFLWETVWTEGAYHPETLTMAHSGLLLGSDALFARKFNETIDSDILKLLAQKIGAPVK
jgi:hypothetical protein